MARELIELPWTRPLLVSPLEHDVDAARAAGALTELETAVLDLESSGWWKYRGAKEQAIYDRIGCSTTRYYQLLAALIRNDTAHRAYPQLVARLRRVRDEYLQRRAAPRRSLP